jgi:hypothetical protein
MGMSDMFRSFDESVKDKFIENYKGELDIMKVLDTSYLKDNLDGLMEEISKQPATYAYWANLRRIAEETYDDLNTKFDMIKARKLTPIVETLRSSGIKNPTSRMVEGKFHEMYKNEEWYSKLNCALGLWKKRKDQLVILEKAVSARENSFRSLSYLISNMMNKGIIHYKPKL